MRKIIGALFVLGSLINVYAQDITFAPNDQGQLNPEASMEWEYGESGFGGMLNVKVDSFSELDDGKTSWNMNKSITTVSTNLSGDAYPMYWILESDSLVIKPGAGISVDWIESQQVGFMDMPNVDNRIGIITPGRLFFNVDRQVLILKPALYSAFEINVSDEFQLSFDMKYSPVFNLSLNQIISSAAAEGTLYDLPKTEHSFQGVGFNAWGFSAAIEWENEFVPLELSTSWQGKHLEYEYLIFGGDKSRDNYLLLNGGVDFMAELSFLSISESAPMLGLGFDWRFVQAQNDDEWYIEQLPIKIYVGIGF